MSTRRATAGETITETLVAMLIVTFTVLFLSTAVVSAARVNNRLKNEDVSFVSAAAAPSDTTVSVRFGDAPAETPAVKLYQTEKGYYYYEYHPETGSTP